MLKIQLPSLKGENRYATFFSLFSICNIFSIIGQCRFFLASGVGPDILMKMFECYIILLTSAGWLLFTFLLKQKQRFSAWSFTEITSIISFRERNFVSNKTHQKNAGFNEVISSITKTKNKS